MNPPMTPRLVQANVILSWRHSCASTTSTVVPAGPCATRSRRRAPYWLPPELRRPARSTGRADSPCEDRKEVPAVRVEKRASDAVLRRNHGNRLERPPRTPMTVEVPGHPLRIDVELHGADDLRLEQPFGQRRHRE